MLTSNAEYIFCSPSEKHDEHLLEDDLGEERQHHCYAGESYRAWKGISDADEVVCYSDEMFRESLLLQFMR